MKRSFALMLLVGLLLQAEAQTEKDHNFEVAKNLEIFNAIYRNLDMMYVDSLKADHVIGTAIDAMFRQLDPYTEYYPEDKTNDLKTLRTGKYSGIGSLIRYHMKRGNAVIDEPYEGTPSADVGLRKGDVILSIDDSTMVGKDTRYVSDHLLGDAGTTFMLKFLRPSTGKEMQTKITRRTIQMPSLPYYGMLDWMMDEESGMKGIGYVNLNSFTENCSKDVRRAVIDLKNQGMKALVLDLRGNGGGSEAEAANIVNLFVRSGVTVASNRGKLKRANHDYVTTVEPLDTVMPLVVLVNGSSASASEITSGALQDLDRAVIVGTRTYGKGLVQLPMDLPYNAQMKLTTSKYYIPSGRCIQAINYKHGDGGYMEHIPDSLTREFRTLGGRIVRDGGGIMPDVEVKPDSLPNIVYYLSASGRDSTEVMFDYEVEYIAKHPTIASPREFAISDEEFEAFKKRVVESGFTYDPESGKAMEDLKKLMEFEGYYEEAKAEFEALENKLNHNNIARDMDRHKEAIKQVMANDIVAAYYFQSGAIENALPSDKQLREACRLLSDAERYRSILVPAVANQ